jgi:excisionase family DNA binding protein
MIQLPDKQLFRPDEVAELMRIKSVETVHGWIRAGKIKYVLTPGGQKRIPRAEFERITREMHEKPTRRKAKEE